MKSRRGRGFEKLPEYENVDIKLQEHEMKDLLQEIGLERIRKHSGRNGTNFMFCCPFHGESNPSAGILLDGYGQCFSCEETFGVSKLVGEMMGLSISDSVSYIEEKFNVEFKSVVVGRDKLKRYDDAKKVQVDKFQRFELPKVRLAPYRSGRETHKYFFDRGFTKETVKREMIGWDRVRKRVTIPVFHRDGTLCGFTGRAVLNDKIKGRPNPTYIKHYGKEPKYYIYDNFPIGEVLYGSHDFYSEDDTAIIVEGPLDRIWMRQLGYRNVVSIIVAKMSTDSRTGQSTQKQILHELGVKRVIFMHDNDTAGETGKKVAHDILKGDFICFDTKFPEGENDPDGMSREDLDDMLDNKTMYGRKVLKRI